MLPAAERGTMLEPMRGKALVPIQPKRTSITAYKLFSFTTSLEFQWKSFDEQNTRALAVDRVTDQSPNRMLFGAQSRCNRIQEIAELAQPTDHERKKA